MHKDQLGAHSATFKRDASRNIHSVETVARLKPLKISGVTHETG
jgi:hypothetical protein